MIYVSFHVGVCAADARQILQLHGNQGMYERSIKKI